jgi:parallel beta-helix repeat protein
MAKIQIIIAIAIMTVVPGWAANYYVDFEGGSDTNNGTSTITPFKHSPGDANASGNANRALTAGDTVFFKGGVTYTGSIAIKWSGTIGNLIKYDGNSSGDWGTGRAKMTGNSPPGTIAVAFYESSAQSYVSFKGFEVYNYRASDNSGGMYNPASGTHTGVVFDSNYIHDVGYWNNDSNNMSGCGIYLVNCNSCEVTNNTIKRTGQMGVHLNGTNNIVSKNTIGEYICWGIDIESISAGNSDHIISENTIYDLYYYDLGYWKLTSEPPHTDYIFLRGDGSDNNCPRNITISANLFYNNASFIDNGGTAMIYDGCVGQGTGPTDNIKILNNVFINAHSYMTIKSHTGKATNYKINNNTFFGGGTISLPGPNTQFKNNIVSNYDYVIRWSGTFPSGCDIDYNIYHSTRTDPFKSDDPYGTYTFPIWKSKYGNDSHSIIFTSIDSIKFNNLAGYPLNSNAMDLRLQKSSPAVNAGIDLSTIFTSDKDGNLRPKGVNEWDIGAYEFDISPPRNLKILN